MAEVANCGGLDKAKGFGNGFTVTTAYEIEERASGGTEIQLLDRDGVCDRWFQSAAVAFTAMKATLHH
jgi:hypothetical protein